MKKTTKLLLTLAATAILAALLALSAFAATYSGSCGADGSNVKYNLDTSTGLLEITGTGAMKNYSSSSGVPWDSNRSSVKTVEISDGVTSICFSAFYNCSSLTSVTIGDSVTSIGESAFSSCSSLTSVTIGDRVTSIGYEAFYDCSSLTSVTIGDSVTSIGSSAFYNTAYYNNSSNWENEVLYIGNHLIDVKASISGSYSVREGTKTIASSAFSFCSSLTSVNIPDSVTSIGGSAFYYCSSLTSVTFETKNATFGSEVFYDCSKLKTIYLYRNSTANAYFSSSYTKKYLDLHTISFDLNGGIGAFEEQIKKECEPLVDSVPMSTKEGYVFDVWSDPDGNTYSAGGDCSVEGDITLTATWKEATYNVTYDANGGSGAPSSQTKYYFLELTLSDKVPARTGYNFGGWSGSDGKTYAAGDTYSTNADITLTAIWEIKVYNITYNANGGENAPEGSTKEHFETVNLSEVIPTKHGYNFGGWRGSDGRTYSAGGACSVNTDIVLTAIWNPMAVTLIYDANGGNVYPSSKTVYYEESYGTLANPTRVGYTFAGWYTEKDGGSRVSSSTYVNTLENITVFAHWSAISYSVSFDANGGTISDGSKRVVFDSEYGTLPTPVLAGFTFDGWYTAIEGGARITDSTIVKNASDHTLYAHWKGASYLLILDANGGKCTPDAKNVDFGEKYGELPVPTRAGYKFITWSKTKSESGAVNADTVHNNISDVTLYAVWAKLGDPNGDDIIDTRDAVLLAQFLAKWDVEIDPISADCNGDGVLDTKDAVLLAQYLAKWDVTLGK